MHGHKKESIKIALNKMEKFKQFMDVKAFEQLQKNTMGSHREKPEVVQVMRALAIKYSDLGKHEQAMTYINRTESLSVQKLPSEQHV